MGKCPFGGGTFVPYIRILITQISPKIAIRGYPLRIEDIISTKYHLTKIELGQI